MVKVNTRKDPNTREWVHDDYQNATNFHIHDGHLVVTGWDGAPTHVAAYVPGAWNHVQVIDTASDE